MLPDGERFVPLEQVIAAKIDALFPGMEILDHQLFRVTRDADFELEDEAEDLLEAIESVLRRRNKFGRVVRLEVDTKMSREVLEVLCRELELSERDVTVVDGPLDLAGLWALYAVDRPELKDDVWVPQTQTVLGGPEGASDFFRVAQAGDVLVHHPYDSFATSVEQFIEQAADDPHVLAIKQTIYRTAGQRAQSCARSSRPRSRASRSSRSSSSKRASTNRPTSNGPACSKKRACTWCTASSA